MASSAGPSLKSVRNLLNDHVERHPSSGAGASAHGDLTGVTADQHHAQAHKDTHAKGGADDISVFYAETAHSHAAPPAHKDTHAKGGSDDISVFFAETNHSDDHAPSADDDISAFFATTDHRDVHAPGSTDDLSAWYATTASAGNAVTITSAIGNDGTSFTTTSTSFTDLTNATVSPTLTANSDVVVNFACSSKNGSATEGNNIILDVGGTDKTGSGFYAQGQYQLETSLCYHENNMGSGSTTIKIQVKVSANTGTWFEENSGTLLNWNLVVTEYV